MQRTSVLPATQLQSLLETPLYAKVVESAQVTVGLTDGRPVGAGVVGAVGAPVATLQLVHVRGQ